MVKECLKRRNWLASVHDGCTYGRIAALYIYRNKKWQKIGEYCKGCGEVAILPEFQKGIN